MKELRSRPRAIFDCNIYVQAIAFEESPAAIAFALAESGEFDLYVSKATLAELRRVLAYQEVLAISPNMTSLRIAAFLKRLTFRANMQLRPKRVFHLARDPKDEPYLDLALSVKADYLVTRDRDLLSLMTGHSVTSKEFRQATHPLKILEPVAFLDAMGRARPRRI